MALYICKNKEGECDNAINSRQFEIRPGEDLRCPVCKKSDIEEITSPSPSGNLKKILRIAIPALLIIVGGWGIYKYFYSSPTTPPEPTDSTSLGPDATEFRTPAIPTIDINNSKLKAVVEMGATGFDYSIIRVNPQKEWELVKYKPGWSMVFEGEATYNDIVFKLKNFIAEIYDVGVINGKDIHFVISSGAKRGKSVPEIERALQGLGYFVNEVTNEQEAKYGLICALPEMYVRNAFVVDVGSSNVKIAWKNSNGEIVGRTSQDDFGSKYRKKNITDEDVYTNISKIVNDIPTECRKNCFIMGGVPWQLAGSPDAKDAPLLPRYITLKLPSDYDANGDDKLIGGLNIYKAIADASGCKTFVFDKQAKFSIALLLTLPY